MPNNLDLEALISYIWTLQILAPDYGHNLMVSYHEFVQTLLTILIIPSKMSTVIEQCLQYIDHLGDEMFNTVIHWTLS